MEQNHGQLILALFEELNSMPEHQTLEKIRHFGASIEIFNGNHDELIYHLEIHNNPRVSLELMSVNKQHLLYAYQKQITRLLHNYIASSLSLTDHARNHYNELYSSNKLFPEYQIEVDKRFTKNPLAVFIKDLRHYFQHFQMPGVTSRLVYKEGAPDFIMTLLLSTNEMKKFSGWKALSKEFLSKQSEDINLFKLINDYHNLVVSFYQWFQNQQEIIHRDDIAKVDSQKNKIRKLALIEFLDSFIKQPITIEEFQDEIAQYFPSDDLKKVKDSITVEEKVENILHLLKQIVGIDIETGSFIRKNYEKK